MKKANTDLSKVLKPYENKWVALADDYKKVVGSGDNILQAGKEASKEGYKNPYFFYVTSFAKSLVPAN